MQHILYVELCHEISFLDFLFYFNAGIKKNKKHELCIVRITIIYVLLDESLLEMYYTG